MHEKRDAFKCRCVRARSSSGIPRIRAQPQHDDIASSTLNSTQRLDSTQLNSTCRPNATAPRLCAPIDIENSCLNDWHTLVPHRIGSSLQPAGSLPLAHRREVASVGRPLDSTRTRLDSTRLRSSVCLLTLSRYITDRAHLRVRAQICVRTVFIATDVSEKRERKKNTSSVSHRIQADKSR